MSWSTYRAYHQSHSLLLLYWIYPDFHPVQPASEPKTTATLTLMFSCLLSASLRNVTFHLHLDIYQQNNVCLSSNWDTNLSNGQSAKRYTRFLLVQPSNWRVTNTQLFTRCTHQHCTVCKKPRNYIIVTQIFIRRKTMCDFALSELLDGFNVEKWHKNHSTYCPQGLY